MALRRAFSGHWRPTAVRVVPTTRIISRLSLFCSRDRGSRFPGSPRGGGPGGVGPGAPPAPKRGQRRSKVLEGAQACSKALPPAWLVHEQGPAQGVSSPSGPSAPPNGAVQPQAGAWGCGPSRFWTSGLDDDRRHGQRRPAIRKHASGKIPARHQYQSSHFRH